MYSLLYTIFLIIFLPFYFIWLKKKGYSLDIKERLVLYTPENLKNPLWFHCASVGELNTAKPLIDFYSKKYNILITVSSPRGKKYAKENFKYAAVRFLPFDYKFLYRKFIKFYNPKVLIVLEGEFWYNFITTTSSFTPVISANTRISPSSYKFYKRLSFLYRKIFNSFAKFLVRSKDDKVFLEDFVRDKDKIVICGDLKFISSDTKKDVFLKKNNKKVLIAGSTHPPEEKILLETFTKLKKQFPDLVLVLAPRHLERLKQIKDLVKSYNLSYSLRTDTDSLDTDVYIIDTLGELSGLYRYADVVFVGGTIADVGGHNILEPALENKPVIIGKNFYKIKELYNILKNYGVVYVIHDEKQLYSKILELLKNKVNISVDFKQLQENIKNCYISNIDKFLR